MSAILILLWLFDKNLKERFLQIVQNKVVIALLLFCVFTLLSLLWSNTPTEGLTYLKRYWYLLPIPIMATYLKKEDVTKVISAFLLGMLVSEIISYGIFFELWTTKHGSPEDPSPFMNHLQYTMFLAFSSLLLLNRFFFESSKRYKIIYFLFFLMTTSNLFINGGRTGQLAFIFGILVTGFLNIKNKLYAFVGITLLTSLILLSAYASSPVFQKRVQNTFISMQKVLDNDAQMYSSSFGQRLAAWTVGMKIVAEKPLLGTGVGAEMHALQNKIDSLNIEAFRADAIYNIKHYHNNYMTYLVQLGVLGLLLYLFIFYSIATLKIEDKEIRNLKYIFLVVFMSASFFEQMFHAQFPLAFFALFVGIFLSSSHSKLTQKAA